MQTGLGEKWEAYCRSRNKALRNELAEEYLYLAQAVARRFTGRGADVEDLTQVASIALLHALERFDCEKGLQFTTFAMPTLAGEVRNYLRDKARTVRLPRRGADLIPRLVKESERFWQVNGREPTANELADVLGVQPDDVLDAQEMRRAGQPVSLDAVLTEDGLTLEALLGREEEAFERIEERDMINGLLSQLEEKSRFVISQRFCHQRSQREIAKELGVSQMQVSRLERRALTALRGKMAL